MKRVKDIYKGLMANREAMEVARSNAERLQQQLNRSEEKVSVYVRRDLKKWKKDSIPASDYIASDKMRSVQYRECMFIKDYCMSFQKPIKGTDCIMGYNAIDDTICFYRADTVVHKSPIRPSVKVWSSELKDFERSIVLVESNVLCVLQFENRFRSIRGESIEYAMNKIKGMAMIAHPHITEDRMQIGTMIGQDISNIVKRIKYLDHTVHYNHLFDTCRRNNWEPIDAAKIRKQYLNMVDRWIDKNQKAIMTMIDADVAVCDILEYASFTKSRGNQWDPTAPRHIDTVYVTMRLTDYYNTPKKIAAVLDTRQDDLLRYARSLIYTDKEVFDIRKDIILSNIVIGNDTSIEFIYNNEKGDRNGYEEENFE